MANKEKSINKETLMIDAWDEKKIMDAWYKLLKTIGFTDDELSTMKSK